MATAKQMTQQDYLQEVYIELERMKDRIAGLREKLAAVSDSTGELFREHDRHLLDMAEYLDWKLQVLEKGTGFDWKAAGTKMESTVSVSASEGAPDISGGYLGG